MTLVSFSDSECMAALEARLPPFSLSKYVVQNPGALGGKLGELLLLIGGKPFRRYFNDAPDNIKDAFVRVAIGDIMGAIHREDPPHCLLRSNMSSGYFVVTPAGYARASASKITLNAPFQPDFLLETKSQLFWFRIGAPVAASLRAFPLRPAKNVCDEVLSFFSFCESH